MFSGLQHRDALSSDVVSSNLKEGASSVGVTWLDALVDLDSTKSMLGREGIELAAEFNQEIEPSEFKAILFWNGSIESVLGQVALPSILDVVQECLEYKVVPNFKY